MNLTPEDIKNIVALINAAPIKGLEAPTVTALLQKLESMLKPPLPDNKK